MAKTFKIAPKPGDASTTDAWFTDATGKSWPIYSKILDLGALPNAGAKNVAHGIANIKLDGHLHISSAHASAGAGGVTSRTLLLAQGGAVTFGVDATNLVVTTTGNLSAQTGRATLEYCISTDNP